MACAEDEARISIAIDGLTPLCRQLFLCASSITREVCRPTHTAGAFRVCKCVCFMGDCTWAVTPPVVAMHCFSCQRWREWHADVQLQRQGDLVPSDLDLGPFRCCELESCGIAKCLSIFQKKFHPLGSTGALSSNMSVSTIGPAVVYALVRNANVGGTIPGTTLGESRSVVPLLTNAASAPRRPSHTDAGCVTFSHSHDSEIGRVLATTDVGFGGGGGKG